MTVEASPDVSDKTDMKNTYFVCRSLWDMNLQLDFKQTSSIL